MNDTTLGKLQRSIDQWINANGGYWDEMSLLARLTEEVASWRASTTTSSARRRKSFRGRGRHRG